MRRVLVEEGVARMLKGFKEFIMRGNVVELAVAVVIGVAFGALIAAFVADIVTPLIAAIAGKRDFSNLFFTINGSKFLYGAFINALLAFLFVAGAIYFFVIVPLNKMAERRQRGEPTPDPTTRACPECLSEIPLAATRCAFCTAQVGASSTPA
jgi:large conductance mechanosensitive channel